MTRVVEVPLDDGSSVLVETDDRGGPTVRGARAPEAVTTAATTLESAMDRVAPASRAIVEGLRGSAGAGPAEIVVEFGLLVRAEVGLVISKAAGEANFSVRATWNRAD